MIQSEKIRAINRNPSLAHKPVVIEWQKEPMIRNHSIKAAVREILKVSNNKDVIRIGIIGDPDTGKTTQAELLSCLLHTMSDKIPFAVRKYKEEDFINIKDTLASLDPANYILCFGDLSFLKGAYGAKKIDELKNAMTKIRHLQGGRDVKIILIYDYHYTLGLDKYLRQSEFKFFTSIGSSEKENMEKIVGRGYYDLVTRFKEMTTGMLRTDTFSYQLGDKWFIYKFRKPFIPMLFWNEYSLRDVVSPTRQWVNPICAVCSQSDNTPEVAADIEKIIEVGIKKFGVGSFEAALKLLLHQNGINVYSPNITNCVKWLGKLSLASPAKLEDIAVKRDMRIVKTRLRHGIEEIINSSSN